MYRDNNFAIYRTILILTGHYPTIIVNYGTVIHLYVIDLYIIIKLNFIIIIIISTIIMVLIDGGTVTIIATHRLFLL
jgi:hypothetical protein